MRKLKLFFACLLMAVLSIGQMWGDSYTITLKNGTGSDDSSSGIQGSTTISDFVADGASYVSAVAGSGKVYQGATGYGLKFGNSKGGGSITLTLAETVKPTSIVVNASQYSVSEGEGVFQGTKYDMTGGGGKGNFNNYTVEYDGNTEVTTISVGCSKRGYVKSITVNYGGSTPPADPYTVSFSTGNGNSTVAAKTEQTAGAGIELPAGPETIACSADGWTFAGWAEAAVASQTTTAPALLNAGANYKPSDDVTLFAVYKKTETGEVTDQEVTETFENQEAGSTYNSTQNYEASASNANIAWTMYYGCVSTDVKLTGNKSAQMRWYKSATSNLGYIQNTTPISGLQSVSFNAKANNANNSTTKISVWYSTNGDDWTKVKDNETAPTSTGSISATIGGTVGTDYYVRIGVGDAGTAPDDKSTKLTIDDVHFSYKAGASTTYYLSSPSCCTPHAITIATGIENGSVTADPTSACEGTAVTLTFTPATNYHLSAWTLNGVAQDVNVNTFSMPAGAATISATFEQDACDPLATPVVAVSGKAYPYDAVKLAWSAIDNADAYKVYIYDNEDNELEHNDAFAGVEYTIGQTLSASTTYKYSVQAISNTPATYCPSTEAESTFTTDALPTAHLTLIALGEEQQASGDYSILTPFALPNTAASCAKTFMGWDANSECASAPTYVKGAEFTFQNTTGVTLYAVYADETPGEATLTKLGSNYAPTAGDKLVIVGVDGDDQYALYRETQSSSYVKHWAFDNNVATVAADAKKYVILEAATNGKFYLGDATNGYVYSSSSNNLSVDASNKTEWTIAWDNNASAFTFSQGKYLSCRSDLSGTNQYLYRLAGGTPAGIYKLDVYKYATSASTYDNYSTTCVAAPTAEPASASIAVAAAGGEGTLGVSYENVNLAGVTVALYNNEACTEAFDGGWLTASIAGDDKHIAYNAQANTSYNDARTAYIKLTAPETNGAANPAVVVIPVEQAKKPAVFASLVDLVAAELASGTEVTVTFANEVITDDQYISQGTKRAGLMLTTKAANNKAIEIFYNKGTTVVPAEWLIGGKLAANAKTFTWTLFNDQWELVPLGNDWTWDNGDLTYTAPKAVSSVVVSGAPDKKNYVDGEKFVPAGLTVTINYNDATSEVNPVGVTFACTPERVAKGATSVEVVATFNEIDSDPFEVTGLTVGDIQLKTVAEFIAAGNADMRCYLEGIVSNITNTQYGNFDLTDASGTIYVYGCLNQAGEAQKFDELGVANGDKIKVIAEDYEYYNSKHEAKNVQFVSKKPVATMTFDAMEMETGDVETIAPKTITEAEASAVAYSIKEGSDDCVSLDGAQITATATGTATIVATLAETTAYVGTTAEFTVTVTAPDTRKIANASAFEAISGDMTPADIAFAAYKGDGTNAPVLRSSDNPVAIRLYKPATTGGTGNYLTLTAKVGCTIDQVQITFSGNADAAYCKDDEALPTEKYITSKTVLLTPADLNAQSVSIVNLKNGSIDVNAIKVWYNGEPLAIDHYFVDATGATTEFVQYSTFDYTGLKVYAAYDELETITEEIFDFNATADLMTAGAKKAEVYRESVKIAEYDITVTESPKQNPALAYNPTSDEITLGDEWTAPAFSNPLNVEGISFSTSNNKVAKVTSAGVITLQGGCGEATITASFAATEEYVASVATYTITVNEPAEILGGKWELVNEILPGMRIIIANEASNGAVKTMGGQNSNNRAAIASTVDGEGVLTPASGTKTFLVVATETEGQFALQARNGNYIYAASNSSNHLKEEASIDANGNANWTIEIDANGVATIKAQGNNSVNWIRYNTSGLFSCYGATNSQEDVYVYAWKPYTRTVSGNYGTICLPNGGVMTNGALYKIAEMDYQDNKPYKIYFDEVEGGVMEAGKPYIFKPNDGVDVLKVVYTDAANAPKGNYNGLYGEYTKTSLAADEGNYILKNNQYWYVNTNNVYCDANRAYIKLAEVPEYDNTQPSYSPRRIALNVNNEQVATGVEGLNIGDQPVKVLINGQIFIFRGEKMYDATGRLVK